MPPQQQARGATAAGDMAKILPAWQKHVQGLKGLLSDRTEAKIYATLGYSAMDTDIVVEHLISQGKDNEVYEDDLVDYDEEVENDVNGVAAKPFIDVVKKGYVRIRNSGFGDFLLKPEQLRAI